MGSILETISLILDQDNFYRENIHIGSKVCIVKKKDQKSGKLTCGHVRRILTSKRVHTRGIKVEILSSSRDKAIGRVQQIY